MFKPRPYDPDRKDTRTPAQKAAQMRNFRVFQLRGLHAQVRLLTGKRRERAMALVDQELKAMGALTMRDHDEKMRRERFDKLRKAASAEPRKCMECGELWDECDCIPF